MNLNPQQKEAVEHFNGPCIVISTAGSGKTRCITERYIRLIQKGIDPKSIICLTFTNKASKEMVSRIKKSLNIDKVNSYIGTFHAFCMNLIRTYYNILGFTNIPNIIDDGDQKSMIEKIIKQLGKSPKEDNIDVYYIIKKMNFDRENMISEDKIIESFTDGFYGDVVEEYFKQIKENNLVDFSGILSETYNLLSQNQDILQKINNYIKYIQVDEVQDTNLIQFQIIELLGGTEQNLFLVGDPNQSLYAFRNARVQNITDFLNKHSNCKKLMLGQNYRSTPQIIKVADTLIKHNKSNMSETIVTENPDGQAVFCEKYFDPYIEAEGLAYKIKDYINQKGYGYSDIAVIYRLNRMSLELQSCFAKNNIPFTVIGGQSLFDRREIKDVIAMMKFAANNKDVLAFHRIAGLFKGFGDTSIGMVENKAKEYGVGLLDVCDDISIYTKRKGAVEGAKKIYEIYNKDFTNMNPGDCLDYLFQKFDYIKHLQMTAKEQSEAQERIDNITEMLVHATDFSKNGGNLNDYLQVISLASNSDTEAKDNSVSLISGHASKGLEFPIVFSIGVETDILPHKLAIMEAKNDEDLIQKIEEERRIFFVCLTRSMKHLHVSYCENRKMRGKNGSTFYKGCKPSQFLYEAGLIKK